MDELKKQWQVLNAAAFSQDRKAFKRVHKKLVELIEEKEKAGLTPEQINEICLADPQK